MTAQLRAEIARLKALESSYSDELRDNHDILMAFPNLLAALERCVGALEFYATAPCSEALITIAPRFRETADKALCEATRLIAGEKHKGEFDCCGGNDDSPKQHCQDCPDRTKP